MRHNEPIWRKSSRSNNAGECVEVAANLAADTGTVLVRDSKDPAGPVLSFSVAAWTDFLTSVHTGALDR